MTSQQTAVSRDDGQEPSPQATHRTANRRTVALLAVIAIAIYAGFIVLAGMAQS